MNAKIVVIEDDVISSTILKHSFKKINFTDVDFYNSAIPFLKSLHSADGVLPEVVIMDYNLPVMSGFQVLAYLKRKEEFANINVILYSCVADENQRRTSLKAGALDFVKKDYSQNSLKNFASRVRALAKTGVYKSDQIIS